MSTPITKIPVPPRHDSGESAAVAACTPEEIYCYTQYNSLSAIPRSFHADAMGVQQIQARTFTPIVDVQNGVGPGRPDRLSQVMSHHPQYLDIFQKAQAFIMRGDGPLPFYYRHFIAIMAAGRHRCGYLIQQQMNEFIIANGDERWLLGLDHIPTKLLDLYEINKILAHQPWLITKHHIEKLTTGSDSWSLGELVQALVIMSHFHSLASFIFGCGISNGDHEPPFRSPSATSQSSSPTSPISPKHPPSSTGIGKHSSASAAESADSRSSSPHSSLPHSLPPSVAAIYVGGSNPGSRSNSVRSSPEWKNTSRRSSTLGLIGGREDDQVGLDALMKRMKSLSERREQFTAEEQIKRYEHVESQSAELGVVSSEQDISQRGFGQFIKDEGFIYQDFANRGGSEGSGESNNGKGMIPTFRVQDYSWDDHAYSLINRLYSDVGNLIDEKFRLTYHLTYYTMGSKKDVDTSRFRRAIWNYIQCMFGIRHDDYDYGEVNQLLERSLKTYIKTAVCFPDRLGRNDYDSILKEFRDSEKIHVNLMLVEARVQAELLYSLRAIMRHMT